MQGAQDVLDALFGVGMRTAPARPRAQLTPELAALLEAIADGHDAAVAFQRAGLELDAGLAGMASLELGGWVRRGPGGRFTVAV